MNVKLFLLTNLLSGIMGIVLLIVGYKAFDLLTPRWNFYEIFQKHPLSGAIVISAFIVGLSAIICCTAG